MASYFEEHDCEPRSMSPAAQDVYRRLLLHLARSVFNGREIDRGSLEGDDWAHRLPPPAAKRVVESLPAVQVTPQQARSGLKCPVCLLEFEEEVVVKKMPCEHFFHRNCILPWLGKTNSCPICRYELPTDDETYEEFKQDRMRREQQAHRLENLHGAMYT